MMGIEPTAGPDRVASETFTIRYVFFIISLSFGILAAASQTLPQYQSLGLLIVEMIGWAALLSSALYGVLFLDVKNESFYGRAIESEYRERISYLLAVKEATRSDASNASDSAKEEAVLAKVNEIKAQKEKVLKSFKELFFPLIILLLVGVTAIAFSRGWSAFDEYGTRSVGESQAAKNGVEEIDKSLK